MMLQVPFILVASITPKYGYNIMEPRYIIWMTLGCQLTMWFKLFDWLRLFLQHSHLPNFTERSAD